MKISVFGLGYVGLANALLLGQNEEVVAYDIVKDKVESLKHRISPLEDKEIIDFLQNNKSNVDFTDDFTKAANHGEYAIIATPTNYDDETNHFDTSTVEDVIEKLLSENPSVKIIIKSTIPVGYTKSIQEKYNNKNIIFSPEFLREGKALYDNLHPTRIVVGEKSDRGQEVAEMFARGVLDDDVAIILTGSVEAEAIKLFSNTYLAMRVSYFNELDSYAEINGLSTKDIIDGMGYDPRIGNYYNNPSFGYGGYCLPKDTKQLKANFADIPQEMMTAIVKSNDVRKKFITEQILKKNPKTVGIYRLTMKANSDNFRSSAIQDIINNLKNEGIETVIYEPTLSQNEFEGNKVINDLQIFKDISDVIVANRLEDSIQDVVNKVYTRDIYRED